MSGRTRLWTDSSIAHWSRSPQPLITLSWSFFEQSACVRLLQMRGFSFRLYVCHIWTWGHFLGGNMWCDGAKAGPVWASHKRYQMNGNLITSPFGEWAGTRTNLKPQRHRRHHWPVIYLSYMFLQQETHVLCWSLKSLLLLWHCRCICMSLVFLLTLPASTPTGHTKPFIRWYMKRLHFLLRH